MKLKYYIRGIGIGIVITTIVFMFANIAVSSSTAKKESEVETKATSSVLAYATTQVDSTKEQATTIAQVSEADKSSKNDNETQNSPSEDYKENTTESKKEQQTDKDKEQTTSENSTSDNSAAARNGEMVDVEIRNVKYLSEVSEILYDMGVIADVSDFNSYMTFSGNDIKVKEGKYTLKAGDTYENIASVITRS